MLDNPIWSAPRTRQARFARSGRGETVSRRRRTVHCDRRDPAWSNLSAEAEAELLEMTTPGEQLYMIGTALTALRLGSRTPLLGIPDDLRTQPQHRK